MTPFRLPSAGSVPLSIGAGEVTVGSLLGGAVTVGQNGIKLSIPQGILATIGNAIDELGKRLGVGTETPIREKVDDGSWNTAGTTDLGNLPIGNHTVGVTNDTRGMPDCPPGIPEAKNIITISVTVQPRVTAPVARSRDRFLTGSIDTANDTYRNNLIEFIDASGTSMGTFRLDGTPGTYIYNSEDDILSDSELDGVINNSIDGSSTQLSQQVVFWRQSANSAVIRFSVVFPSLGNVKIHVTNSSGADLGTTNYTLTAEPNFGGLLDYFAERLTSLDMPEVTPWSFLPPIYGIDDDDGGYSAIGSGPTSPYRVAAMRTGTSGIRSLALTGWANNLLAKLATAADVAIDLASSGTLLSLKIGGGFIKGMIDGIWDGAKSDYDGLSQLVEMGVFGLHGDIDRAKAMWDGIRQVIAEVKANGGRKIFDQMLNSIVDTAQVSVPWNNVGSTSDQWGVFAYVEGYAAGFIIEQIVVMSTGAGLVAKAGQSVKIAFLSTRAGQITAAMVSNSRRFVSANFVAATKHVAALGAKPVRSVRKAVDDVAKRAVFQGKLVGEEIGALMKRLGVSQITYQEIVDKMSVIAHTESDWLKILPTIEEHLADLSAHMGNQLTASAVRGYMEFLGRSLLTPSGEYWANFLHACSTNGVTDYQAIARILEMFDSAGSTSFKFARDVADPTKWISPGGWIFEQESIEGHRISHVLTHGTPNYVKPNGGLKATHSVFAGLRQDIFKLVDEAWTKPKVHPLVNGVSDDLVWICDMGRVVGTNGETKIKIVVKQAGSRSLVTAFPTL